MSFAIEAKALVKVFGNIKALDNLSFKVSQGEIYGLIGPNGAGKTTALRILTTLILPTSGSVVVFGHEVVHDAAQVRKLVSYLPGLQGIKRLPLADTTGTLPIAAESDLTEADEAPIKLTQ